MKFSYIVRFFLLISLLFFACKKDKSINEYSEIDNNIINGTISKINDWYQIKIPTDYSHGITSMYGSIEDTLFISRMFDIIMTVDKGNTWLKVVPFSNIGLWGIAKVKDELVCYSSIITKNDLSFGYSPVLFSVDNGKTWNSNRKYSYDEYEEISLLRTHIDYGNIITIKSQKNINFKHPQFDSEEKPDYLILVNNNDTAILATPYVDKITNLYHDKNGLLYVGTEGVVFEPDYSAYNFKTQSGIIRYPTRQNVCFLYYKKLEAFN
ncbi:MAG: hypothetical protein ACI35V_00545 [Sphingobacterium composti]|uniref:hypothetical protein n=1 Tax=Sphingobacterium composti TaxID=363260 RepID=UPI00135B8CB3|nr:hypothetical protein [Sphingobacterium composti Ten et al. 2007 non Yoo et al. 2007]